MIKSTAIVVLAAGICGTMAIGQADGQGLRPFDAPRQNAMSPYGTAEARPTVSPYVNLTYGSNGLSNYQTLVRPLIEERESLNRQWAELDKISNQLYGTAAVRPSGPSARRTASHRFMHYSHYFGTDR